MNNNTEKREMNDEKKMVLDSHRGIYFGRVVEVLNDGKTVRMEDARHCFEFRCDREDRGVYALATDGPGAGSRIGPEVTMTVNDVSKIIDCAPDARARWEAATWGE